MPEAAATGADVTSTSMPPTNEEIAVMMELKLEQEQWLERRAFYQNIVNHLYNDFIEAYHEDCCLRQENDNLRAELVKVAAKFGFDTPEEHQATSAQVGESIEEFFLHMLKEPSSKQSRSCNLPSVVLSGTPYSDSEHHMGAAAFDVPNCTAHEFSLNAHDMQTAASATVGGDLTARTLCSVEAPCVNTGACAPSNTAEQNVVSSAQTGKANECNPSSQRSPMCRQIQQHGAKATIAMEPSCDDLSVASPLQSPAMHTETRTNSQGECSFTAEDRLHPYPARETTGTSFESSPPAPSSSPIGEATTLVVRNIPTRYSKDMLLQELPPDGTYDFFYLPFSFQKMKITGYLFVNFTSNAAASAFYSQWHGRSLGAQESSAKLNIGVAEVQGLEENVRQLIKRNIKRIKNPMFQPSVFDGLQEVPFSAVVEQMGRSSRSSSDELPLTAALSMSHQ